MNDNKLTYPSPRDLRTILEESVSRRTLLGFLRKKGIFFFNVTRSDLATKISEMVLDYDDLQVLRSFAYKNTNKQILSGFSLTSDVSFDLTSIYNNVRNKGIVDVDGYKLNTISRIPKPNGEVCYGGSLIYSKKMAGRIEFIRSEERDVSFFIKKIGDNHWQVEVDGGKSSDGKTVFQMLDKIVKNYQVKVDSLKLDYLSRVDTISFFDRLTKEGLKSPWKFEDTERITLKRHAGTYDDTEEEDDDEAEKEVSKEHLSGISQAILEGKNLRENKFVNQAEKSGYAFTSMTYVFSAKDKKIKIRAEFKRNPKIFEVCLENYLEPSATKKGEFDDMLSTLEDSENMKIRSDFWNNAKNVFRSIQEERMKPVGKEKKK